jgi:hypothetical protein
MALAFNQSPATIRATSASPWRIFITTSLMGILAADDAFFAAAMISPTLRVRPAESLSSA